MEHIWYILYGAYMVHIWYILYGAYMVYIIWSPDNWAQEKLEQQT